MKKILLEQLPLTFVEPLREFSSRHFPWTNNTRGRPVAPSSVTFTINGGGGENRTRVRKSYIYGSTCVVCL